MFDSLFNFFVGLFVGGGLGVTSMALVMINKDSEDRDHEDSD